MKQKQESKYKPLLEKLKINETFTKPTKKPKVFTKVRDNVPLVPHYNYMMDLLFLPETDNKYKYLLVCVDLANSQFDIEPLKTKEPKEILQSFLKMFTRPYIKKPFASIQTDSGNEFSGIFAKYLYDESIFHKKALPNRHSQMSTVESLNRQLGRLFNGYMNRVEIETGEQYNNWDDIIDIVRTELNKLRIKKIPKDYKIPIFDTKEQPKFKVGDIVHRLLDYPRNALNNNQNTANFRTADFRWEIEPRKITKILYMSGKLPYRYMLSGINNASYTESQLMKSDKKVETYQVKKIIGKKTDKNKNIFYLVWWKGYKRSEATYEPKAQLIKDGIKPLIDEFEKKK